MFKDDLNYTMSRIANSSMIPIARTCLAFGTLVTLSINSSYVLFIPSAETFEAPVCNSLNSFTLFCLLNPNLELARLIACLLLLVVLSGWRPRFTCLIHWYVSFSLTSSATLLDGGDHITAILCFLLIPICLFDSRVWQWTSPPPIDEKQESSKGHSFLLVIPVAAYFLLRIQVAIIYLNAGISKVSVDEWIDGTVIYYWFTHPTFGAPNFLNFILQPIYDNHFWLTMLCWGSMALEIMLFTGLFAKGYVKKVLFVLGVTFHFFIFLVHGLFSFFFAMTGALIIYLLPLDINLKEIWTSWRTPESELH